MQTPPPFHGYEGQPAPQKKKMGTGPIVAIVLGVFLVCCGLPVGALVFGGFKLFNVAMSMGGCMVNVEMMKKALHQYSQEHNGKLPNADTWQTDIAKYLKSTKGTEGAPMKFWKPEGEWTCQDGDKKTGFAFNEDMSGKVAADIYAKNRDAIAIFETNKTGFNQVAKFKELPFKESPRFMGGIINQPRGWFVIDVRSTDIFTRDKNGHLTRFDMNFDENGKHGSISIDSNSDSNDSKDDNSN